MHFFNFVTLVNLNYHGSNFLISGDKIDFTAAGNYMTEMNNDSKKAHGNLT